ncbi:hypothetical protein FIM07_01405 [SAR202 cluster bacterium AD-802-F09_MRT_200m]|nr:hypothetical protein [SAR202 cluster bacterium AD-802-F09_MRT_200m]
MTPVSTFVRIFRSVNRRARFKKARLRDRVHGIIDRAYFNESVGVSKEKRKLTFHCAAWGHYLDWFFSYTLPSLLQDGNIPALAQEGYELKLDLYTHPEEFQAITEKYSHCLNQLNEYLPIRINPLREIKANWMRGFYLRSALVDQIRRCIEDDAIFINAGPDMIFGNRSIANGVRLIQGKNVCLASAHPRINPQSVLTSEEFNGLKKLEKTIENDELVDLAFEHGQPSLLAFFDNEDSNMTHAGISIRQINDCTYSVIHNTPTPYLANFVKDDLKFFASSGSSWDTRWPRLLFRQNRLKIAASSELFFNVELAPTERSNPELQSGLLNNDKFSHGGRRRLHNYVCNSLSCTWIRKMK